MIFSTVFAIGALALDWLIRGESSPLHQYFIWHIGIPNFWLAVNTIPYVIGILLSHIFTALYLSDSIGGYIGLFVQWFIIGFLISALWKLLH